MSQFLNERDGDSLRRFVFEHADIRGEMVSLDATWHAVLERRDYPPTVRDLLGEAMAAAMLLAGTVKFEGSLTLQFHGDGPVYLMVVECSGRYSLRGLAHWREPLDGDEDDLLGDGRVAITIDPGPDAERYQGIVELVGRRPAEAVEAYFRQSEQIDTRLWLAADGQRAGGLLLQALPGGVASTDTWHRATTLADTITGEEILALPVATLLHRLYAYDDIRIFEEEPVSFRCGCSRARVERVLRQFGEDEVNEMLQERDPIEVTCEFCNKAYYFDRVDAANLFAAAEETPPTSSLKH